MIASATVIILILLCLVLLALPFAPLYIQYRSLADLKRQHQAAIEPALLQAGFRRPAYGIMHTCRPAVSTGWGLLSRLSIEATVHGSFS